jgi:hypothetical protein
MERDSTQLPQGDWAKIQSWTLPALVIILFLTGIDTLVHFAGQRDRTAVLLSSSLPRDYQRTVIALVGSTGQACRHLCAITSVDSLPNTATLLVGCGDLAKDGRCHTSSRYQIMISPAAEPSR